MDTLYIHVRHWLFWYGVYAFCDKSCNDEITVYLDAEKQNELAYFEITTITSLEYLIHNEIDKLEDAELYNEVEEFLKSNSDIYYTYIYPRDDVDVLYQVKHYAPVNEKGHKPIYIEMWSKLVKCWDINEIKKCVKILAKEFLNEDISNVEILDIPTYEEARMSYEKYMHHMKIVGN